MERANALQRPEEGVLLYFFMIHIPGVPANTAYYLLYCFLRLEVTGSGAWLQSRFYGIDNLQICDGSICGRAALPSTGPFALLEPVLYPAIKGERQEIG